MDKEIRVSDVKSRNSAIDWIAGLLILVAIFLHIDRWAGDVMGFWDNVGSIFGFFMPWFFFKSGMFYKDGELKRNDYKIWRFLGIPFLFFSAVSWIVWLFTALYMHRNDPLFLLTYSLNNVVSYGILPGNGALYFIASLWLCKYIYPRIHRVIWNNYIIAITSYVLAYLCKCFDTILIHRYLLLTVPISLIGLSYYAMGVQWRKSQYKTSLCIASVVIYAVAIIFGAKEVSFAMAGVDDSLKTWCTAPFVAMASIIVWNNMIRYVPEKFLQIINLGYIGRNSMSYYCIHLIIISMDFFMFRYFGWTIFGLPLIWSYIVSCAVILPVADVLLRRYLPWAVGAKGHVRKGHAVGAAADPLP